MPESAEAISVVAGRPSTSDPFEDMTTSHIILTSGHTASGLTLSVTAQDPTGDDLGYGHEYVAVYVVAVDE